MNQHNLPHELVVFKAVRDRLAEENATSPDDPVIVGTAEGECNLPEILQGILREARHNEALAAGLSELIAQSRARLDRLQQKAKRLKAIAFYGMCEAGLKKLEAPDFTASRSKGRPSVIVTETDPAKIPDEFCRVTREVNKTAIRDALVEGKELPFAFMSNGDDVLTIRS